MIIKRSQSAGHLGRLGNRKDSSAGRLGLSGVSENHYTGLDTCIDRPFGKIRERAGIHKIKK